MVEQIILSRQDDRTMLANVTSSLVTRREFVQTGLVVGAFGIVPASSKALLAEKIDAVADAPATHNMLAIGQSSLFLSHLPMFDKVNPQRTDYSTPHRFQVILEAKLTAAVGDPQKTYVEDRRSHSEVRMYTPQPRPFVLAVSSPQMKIRRHCDHFRPKPCSEVTLNEKVTFRS